VSPSDLSGHITVTPATWRDFRDILALERACFEGDSWPWIDVMAALTFPDAVRLKAVAADPEGTAGAMGSADGRQTIGFVFGDRHRAQGLGWIASIGVHPSYQRRGIGSRLLAACERALGTPQVRLTLRPSNVAARRVYDAAGYVEISRLQHYYRNGEDGIVMEKLTG
jgi:ribosomal-protein-alanine N-acetyltransferase